MDNIEVNVTQIQSNGIDKDWLRIECMVAFCEYCKSDEILRKSDEILCYVEV